MEPKYNNRTELGELMWDPVAVKKKKHKKKSLITEGERKPTSTKDTRQDLSIDKVPEMAKQEQQTNMDQGTQVLFYGKDRETQMCTVKGRTTERIHMSLDIKVGTRDR